MPKSIHIIGGGVVGLCSAYFLNKEGYDVTIVDKSDLSDGASYGNAGMIVPSHFVPLAAPGVIKQGMRWMFDAKSPFYIKPRLNSNLISWLWKFYRSSNQKHVDKSIPVLLAYNQWSKQLYQEFANTEGFDFNFEQKGLLMLCQSDAGLEEEHHVAEQGRKLGLEIETLSSKQVSQLESEVEVSAKGAFLYKSDAHLYSNKFMSQLKAHLINHGVKMLSKTQVSDLETHQGKITKIITSSGNPIKVDKILVASGSWSAQVLRKLGIKMLLQDGKGYSLTLRKPAKRPLYPTILTEAKVAITPMGEDLRIGGTLEISNLSPKINPKRLAGIIDALPKYYPGYQVEMPANEDVWHGFRPCSPDGLPYMGKHSKFSNLTVATGHAMMGMSLGPASGKLACEIITGAKPSINLELLRVERFT